MIVKTERVWDRKDVKAALAAQRQGAVVVTQAEAAPGAAEGGQGACRRSDGSQRRRFPGTAGR